MKANAYVALAQAALLRVRQKELRCYKARQRFGRLVNQALYRQRW